MTISSQIELADLGPDEQNFIDNNSSNNLTIGSIDFGAYTINPAATANRRVNLYSDTAAGSITLAGTYTDSVANHYGQLNINENVGGVYVTSAANFSGFLNGTLSNYTGGSEYIDNSTFLSTFTFSEQNAAGGANAINLVGAQTIQAGLYDSMKNSGTKLADGVSDYGYAHINQSTVNQSTWAGYVTLDGSNLNLSAVTGGRLNVTGSLAGSTPLGLIVSGAGTVVIANPNGNPYTEEDGNAYIQSINPVAADLQSGTTLITNTKGSAFGTVTSTGKNPNGSATNITTNPAIVKLEAGATLGGTGISLQQIVAAGATSIVTAGDPGQASLGIAPSIGQLNLTGGLTTGTNGMTFDFKLNGNLGGAAPVAGQDNDLIVLGDLTLNGPITVNVTSLDGAVAVGTAYTFMEGPGAAWGGTDLSFNVNAPAGYKLDPSYGTGGYEFNVGLGDDGTGSKANTFSVEFELAPEPSTYALLGLGLLALFSICRWTHKATTHRFEDDQLADLK